MNLGSPTGIEIEPNEAKTEFRFLLTFSERTQPVEFLLSTPKAMMLMGALQRIQGVHEIPIPSAQDLLRKTGFLHDAIDSVGQKGTTAVRR